MNTPEIVFAIWTLHPKFLEFLFQDGCDKQNGKLLKYNWFGQLPVNWLQWTILVDWNRHIRFNYIAFVLNKEVNDIEFTLKKEVHCHLNSDQW